MEGRHVFLRIADEESGLPAQKKAVNVSINRELLKRARISELNLSNILESALELKLKEVERARWLAENRAAIEAYNEDVESHGVFGDGLRSF